MFRIKPHTHQRHSEESNKPGVHQDPETTQILSQNCVWASPVEVQVSSGLPQGLGLWVWHKPSWRRSPLTKHRATRTYTGLGDRLLEGTNKTLCAPGSRRKEQWPHRKLTQTCPRGSWGLRQWCGSVVACCKVLGTQGSRACMGPFEGGHCYLHYLHHSLASGHITEGWSPTHQQKMGLKIYWIWPCPSEQDLVSPYSVSPIRKLPWASYPYPSEPTEWKPGSQKTDQTDHMDHSLF